MNRGNVPIVKDLVLIGGGHSHVTVLKRFGMKPIPGVQLTLISPDVLAPYSGMLPGLIAEHYTHEEAHIDLTPLCRFAGARFFVNAVTCIDPQAQLVHVAGRPPVPYDVLSINCGSTPDPSVIAGAQGRVIPVKPVREFLVEWEALKQRVLASPACRIGAVGAGAGGIELVLSAQFALRNMLYKNNITDEPEFHILTQANTVLTTHNRSVQANFLKIMEQRNIILHRDFPVDKISGQGAHAGGKIVELDEILWVTGANAPPWIKKSGFEVDSRGFIKTHPSLQAVSHSNVFAAGDIASVEGYPRPKSGVFAVRQGYPLENNLRRALFGKTARPFKPQSAFLSLISTGSQHAVASHGNWCISGDWVWRWKDRIDREFMRKFNHLPQMDNPETHVNHKLPKIFQKTKIQKHLGPLEMRCGGCGAKVDAATISNIVTKLPRYERQDIIAGLDAPDDAAIFTPPSGKYLVQSVDFFRVMIDDPFVFGQITANHALGDIYAMGAEPHSALALAALPLGLPHKTEALLNQMMNGAGETLAAAHCTLMGGHSSESMELGLGFSVTGVIEPSKALRKTGMSICDALILTKPIGSGTVFAANMRGKARGPWLERTIANARVSNAKAAQLLRLHGASACTDVTGFGLVGHLHELTMASDCNVALDLAAIPVIDGAMDTLEMGIVSSMQNNNLHFETTIVNGAKFKNDLRYQLLFDPQTAGGLLASVPSVNADVVVDSLRNAGYRSASVVGTVLSSAEETKQRITLC